MWFLNFTNFVLIVGVIFAYLWLKASLSEDNDKFWCDNFFSWTRTSESMLSAIERKLFSYIKTGYKAFYVDIGKCVGKSDKIWTVTLNTDLDKTPLVLLHGMGAGVALWLLNLDAFSKHRPVYAIDLLGFGKSSRPNFSNDPETDFVRSIEQWRQEMNLNEFILLGHSMGGFLAASYTLQYPDRVKHLILADPWGFAERDDEKLKTYPWWARTIGFMVQPLNPLWPIRLAGPWGKSLLQRARRDITFKFSKVVEDDQLIPSYIHQCNAQKPSGESAFHGMMSSFGWAKNPMVLRIPNIRKDVPITFLYGAKSWIESKSGETVKEKRIDSFVEVKHIQDAGHHIYADQSEDFNDNVNEICFSCDKQEDKQKSSNVY